MTDNSAAVIWVDVQVRRYAETTSTEKMRILRQTAFSFPVSLSVGSKIKLPMVQHWIRKHDDVPANVTKFVAWDQQTRKSPATAYNGMCIRCVVLCPDKNEI